MSFLQHTAKQIWEQHGSTVSDHLFLFPSRRSMLYFKRTITEAAGQNLWMPDCTTLENWILEQSDFLQIDTITAAFELYQSALRVNFTSQSFELFYPLAQVILKDFDQVDMALIDTETFWIHASSWQAIAGQDPPPDIWNEMKDTRLKKKWLFNWNALKSLYTNFANRLKANNFSTKGRIYRDTAEGVEDISPLSYPHIHVIGFSSLTKAEAKILDFFQSEYTISFYWSIPQEMLASALDAGNNVKKWSIHFGQDLMDVPGSNPTIQLINCSGMVPQIKEVSQLLSLAEGKEERMAVLLPNPSLIDLFLHSFPENRSQVNVSLGYPLIYSPVRSLIEWILSLWEVMGENDGQMTRPGLERIWSHLYIANYMKMQKINLPDSRQLYFNLSNMAADDIVSSSLYSPLGNTSEILNRLVLILEELIPAQPDAFHREVLRYMVGRLVRLNDVLSHIKDFTIVFITRILLEMMQTASVPFRGEPMKGVQVLGIQEVQNLSFNTLIIPGMNEEILPSGKIKSMIPYSLRQHYGLEDQGDMHTIQSYYIWSAILQASKVYLLYSQGEDLLGAKGLSRYLFQLKYGNLKIPFEERFLDLGLEGFEPGQKEIWMTENQEKQLRSYLQEQGLSPTALMSYVGCSFQFFLRYVLRISEDDKPAVGLDFAAMGTVIHDVMFELYEPWQHKVLTGNDFKAINDNIIPVTHKRYCNLYPDDSTESLMHGVHWVEQEIIIRSVRRFVEYDAKLQGIKIDMLEGNLEQRISTENIENVRLRGKIDRLDIRNDVYRVIDYKTGASRLNSTSTLSKLWEDKSSSHNWQVLFYAYLLKDRLGTASFEMGHYTLKDKKLYVPLKIKSQVVHTYKELDEFEAVLKQIINAMIDPEIPFTQTDKISYCQYCVFNTFCERQGMN